MTPMEPAPNTNTRAYADYLIGRQGGLRAKFLQMPYRVHLRNLKTGRTLDVGCGAGRLLKALSADSMGVDHNPLLVQACLDWGMQAMTTEQWAKKQAEFKGAFDSIIFSHVAEHMTAAEFEAMLRSFVFALRPKGRAVLICPQEAGYATDPTHVEYMDGPKLSEILRRAGFEPLQSYSFPFPSVVGKFFKQNETVVIGALK